MNVSDRLSARQEAWQELDILCRRLERLRFGRLRGDEAARFAALYRSTCADLALAEAYQLPSATVEYLNRLVGRAHNQLYRSQTFNFRSWGRQLFIDVPRTLLFDHYFHFAFVTFWGVFILCGCLAAFQPEFAVTLLGEGMLDNMESMYDEAMHTYDANERAAMQGFYVFNNPGIGFQCFACGLLLGVGGLYITIVNAAILGTVFGHMATTEQAGNFFEFVTAHGPFELTAIALMAGAGMRLGFALAHTHGYTRADSVKRAAKIALPTAMTGVVLFCLAAVIEAFISPSPLPYPIKAGVAIVSTALLLIYYFGLGTLAQTYAPADETE